MTQQQEYAVLAMGATMTSLGLATAQSGEVIVLESRGCPAPEFAGALYVGKGRAGGLVAPQTAALESELVGRGILANGNYHVPALAPVMFRHIRDAGLNCLFWTDIVRIEPDEGGSGYAVDYFNASGLSRIKVSKIMETMAGPGADGTLPQGTVKSLWALLHGCAGTDASEAAAAAGIDWRAGCFASESYFGIRLEPHTDWPQARRYLLEAWRRRPAALADTRIAALATEFQYDIPRGYADTATNLIRRISASYDDPLAAFDVGIGMATEEWQ